MTYVAAEARQRLLDTVAEAVDQIAVALAGLGDAYEQLDVQRADELEETVFTPVQRAYGRAKRAHAEFAARHGLPGRTFAPGQPGTPCRPPAEPLERALDALAEVELILTELQDSMLPVEVGDPDLRAALAEVRSGLGGATGRTEAFMRLLGR
jgi:hypothetical protein